LSMALLLRGASVQQGATEAVQAVMYISAEKGPVLSCIMVMTTTNSSLSSVSQFLLGAKNY
jgi:hypothetical protein